MGVSLGVSAPQSGGIHPKTKVQPSARRSIPTWEQSCQSDAELDGTWRQQSKLERRLERNWQRAKGMHHATHERLLAAIWDCEERWNAAFVVAVAKLRLML